MDKEYTFAFDGDWPVAQDTGLRWFHFHPCPFGLIVSWEAGRLAAIALKLRAPERQLLLKVKGARREQKDGDGSFVVSFPLASKEEALDILGVPPETPKKGRYRITEKERQRRRRQMRQINADKD